MPKRHKLQTPALIRRLKLVQEYTVLFFVSDQLVKNNYKKHYNRNHGKNAEHSHCGNRKSLHNRIKIHIKHSNLKPKG